ncbi:MAG TPA: hypothetical protein VGW77_07285 [Candidatus Binatia bacterium]|jgi:hypothetical protein|nr:hypothetical protein [Candidatus Binatia bacterium]
MKNPIEFLAVMTAALFMMANASSATADDSTTHTDPGSQEVGR